MCQGMVYFKCPENASSWDSYGNLSGELEIQFAHQAMCLKH
jgi:hypothetical protein